MRTASVVCLLAAALAATPAAAELGPKRASDSVTLLMESSGNTCAIAEGATNYAFSERVLVTGERVPFVVPKGKVLMVRRVNALVLYGTVGVELSLAVLAGPPTNPFGYALRSIITDNSGVANFEFDFPVGFAVAPGSSVCLQATGAGASPNARLEGFLAPAK
jgi:hypothetical protein